jgi:hypothetical protein
MENKSTFMALIGQQAGEPGRASKYDPEHGKTLRLLAQDGKFPEEWACEIGVSLETIRRWGHTYPEFRDSLVIAKHLLAAHWTRKIADNVNSETAKPAMYAMLIKRFPALYGKEPIDLTDWVLSAPDSDEEGLTPKDTLTQEAARAMPDADIRARIDALRKRREEEGSDV